MEPWHCPCIAIESWILSQISLFVGTEKWSWKMKRFTAERDTKKEREKWRKTQKFGAITSVKPNRNPSKTHLFLDFLAKNNHFPSKLTIFSLSKQKINVIYDRKQIWTEKMRMFIKTMRTHCPSVYHQNSNVNHIFSEI